MLVWIFAAWADIAPGEPSLSVPCAHDAEGATCVVDGLPGHCMGSPPDPPAGWTGPMIGFFHRKCVPDDHAARVKAFGWRPQPSPITIPEVGEPSPQGCGCAHGAPSGALVGLVLAWRRRHGVLRPGEGRVASRGSPMKRPRR